VAAGTGPGEGKPEHRGWHLKAQAASAAKVSMAHLLVPLAADGKPPTALQKDTLPDRIVLIITWPDGRSESVQVKLGGDERSR